MSTDQQTKPRRANQSIADESGRPGTVRSNVGCDAIDEPWTNSTAGFPSGVPANFSHRNRRTSPLLVQCSTPLTVVFSMALVRFGAGLAHDLRPLIALGAEEGAELRG